MTEVDSLPLGTLLIQEMCFDDVPVGATFTTGGRTVTDADVVNFAGLSGDFHSLHMDETFAASTTHGRRLAHGMLVVSMTAGLVAKLPLMGLLERTTLGLVGVECKFLKPTFIGDTIRVVLHVVEKTESRKLDRGAVVMRRTVLNQNGDAVIEGIWKLIVRRLERSR